MGLRRWFVEWRLLGQAMKDYTCQGEDADFYPWGTGPVCIRDGCDGEDCVVAPLIQARYEELIAEHDSH